MVNLNPTPSGFGDKEYDEDDVEIFAGERGVLDSNTQQESKIETDNGPVWEPTKAEGSLIQMLLQNPLVHIRMQRKLVT